jgi:putative peptide zinc metalloprotease protein
MTAAAATFNNDTPVPKLRSELTFSESDYDATGEKGVVLHDPLRHRFFRLPASAGRMLSHWQLGKAGEIADASDVEIEDIEEFIGFLSMSRLTFGAAGGFQSLEGEYKRGEKSLGEAALHNYLFFRIPLFNPTPFLDATLPIARTLASKWMLILISVLGVIGFYFAFRQWDTFVSTFFDFFSLEGLALYSTTLVGLKICHELGHGYMARHFKCRVPVMGVAFMVLAPMLYTETSDAWRLQDKRQRLLIDAAGVLVEMAIAAFALFLWSFLPSGPWRSAMYFISATAWIMSLTVNISPFMRFDGYHLLADALGMYNLGPRVFALATWHMRQFLFATTEPPPEQFSQGLRRWLIAFAWGTWIYRLTLYLGIAYTVYIMFPKAVGIPLALVEIMFFTALPVWRELKGWHAMGIRNLLSTRRAHWTIGIVCMLLVLCVLPLNRSISIPAVLLPEKEAMIYPSEPAQLRSIYVKVGEMVEAGQVLAELDSADVLQSQKLARLRLEITEAKLAHITVDRRDLASSLVLEKERETSLEELKGLEIRLEQLQVRANISGRLAEINPDLQPGVWLGRDSFLFHIVQTQGAVVAGLVSERESGRLLIGSNAQFVPEDGYGAALKATLTDEGSPGSEGRELTYLSSTYGGAVAVEQGKAGGRPIPVSGVLPVKYHVDGLAPAVAQRGTLTAEAESTSFMAMAFGRLVSVFLRESGF